MRVLLISHTCQSATEGQPRAQHLGRIPGIDLCVLVPDRWKHYGQWRYPDTRTDNDDFTLKVGRVRNPWFGPAQFYLHWYPELARLMRTFRPDIIDLWEEPWGLVSAQACRLRNRIAPDALILSETEQNIDKRLPPPFEQMRSYTLANADWAIGRSEEAVGVLRAKGYAGPATVIPNAVDSTLFRPMDKPACRQKLGLQGFVVGFIGRLVPEKGVEDLLDMLDQCPTDVNLVFAGNGPMLPQLQRIVAAKQLTDRVRFLGSVAPENLPTLMNALDVLALPSRSTRTWKEQFGRVIIEAQACKVPVIGSKSGAIPAVVGGGGLTVAESSPTELARAVSALRQDPALAQSLGQAGLEKVHQQYTWQTIAQKYADTYQFMLARQRSPGSSPKECAATPAATSPATAAYRSPSSPSSVPLPLDC